MKWMEMIRVRSSAAGVEAIKNHLSAQRASFRAGNGLEAAFVLAHGQIDGDLAVVMVWNNDRQPVKTRESLLLARYFEQFGSVDHTVWTKYMDLNGDLSDVTVSQSRDGRIPT